MTIKVFDNFNLAVWVGIRLEPVFAGRKKAGLLLKWTNLTR